MLCSNSKNISRNDMDKSATFDLEADGLLPTATRVWCGVVKDSVTKEIFKYGPNNIHQLLKKLEEYGELKAHNGLGYDFPLLEKLYGWKYKGKKTDTLVLSRLLNPKRVAPYNYSGSAGPHSVEVWGCRLGRKKPDHEDWSKYSEEMLHRCTEDVEIQEQIFDTLIKEMSGGDWSKAVPLTMKLFEYLQMQESYGWKVDTSHMNTCIHQLDFWMDRIDRVLKHHLPFIIEVQEQKEKGEYKYVKKPFLKSGDYSKSTNEWYNSNGSIISTHRVAGPFSRITFRRVDLDKAVEVKKFLLASGWEPLEWNTNDAGEQTSPKLSKDDPFEGIQGGVGRLIARRVQCKQRKGIITGLLSSVREDGRIGSAVNNLAVTGRATHRGIVNIPKVGSFYGKQMRKIFSCPEGKVLVGTDSDGCQLRMLAGRMNNPAYTEALCNGDKSKGTDNHSLTAKIGELESRDIAKNVMYCLLFGGGDTKLAKTARKPIGAGADLRDKLYKGLDGLGELMDSLTKEWRMTAKRRYNTKWNKMEYYNGYITGLDGRPILVPFEHQLLVYLLQSDESIMMSAAYCRFHQRMFKLGYEYGRQWSVIMWMHDEFTCECDEDIADIVAKEAEDAIAWAGNFYNISCPHVGDSKIGRNWYEIH